MAYTVLMLIWQGKMHTHTHTFKSKHLPGSHFPSALVNHMLVANDQWQHFSLYSFGSPIYVPLSDFRSWQVEDTPVSSCHILVGISDSQS